MKRILIWTSGVGAALIFTAACLAAVFAFVIHLEAVPYFESRLLVTQDATTTTPASYGVAYHAMTIDSHGRLLRAWTVDARAKTPAILF
ncbi:MAG: hypothetical protein EPN40_09140, partial [Rhodanobacteraceae bacterium]